MEIGAAAASGPIVTATVPAPGATAGAFLRSARGGARGFWSHGERWVAHRGVAARVVSEGGPSRFSDLQALGREILASAGPAARAGEPGHEPAPRLYGGFSFLDGHRPDGIWDGFPAGLFVLPEVELEAGDRRAVLRGRARLAPGADPEEVSAASARMLERLGTLAGELERAGSPPPPRPARARREESARGAWESAVDDVLAAIRAGGVSKVVLARTLDVECDTPPDPVDVVLALERENRGTHVFLYEPVPGRALVGAAPETVVTLRDGSFHATAVAGSIGRGGSESETARLADRLLESGKDRREHAIALEDMVERLRPLAEGIRAAAEPHVLRLAGIQHLETRIEARVPAASALDVLDALHPTPAVCGLPRDEALRILRSEEPFERGWYAGPVGFFDGEGNGVFAPALRSAVSDGSSWRLFAGAGIVAGSDPAAEWEETRIKFEPVLRALEAAGAESE